MSHYIATYDAVGNKVGSFTLKANQAATAADLLKHTKVDMSDYLQIINDRKDYFSDDGTIRIGSVKPDIETWKKPKTEKELKVGEGPDKMTAGESNFNTIINFAAKNKAISLHAVRAGWRLYVKMNSQTVDGQERISNFAALGISAVAQRKEDYAITLITQLKDLGQVPIIFAGAGSTFKAFLYLGYDFFLHWVTLSTPTEKAQADFMDVCLDNVQRVIPAGDIRNSTDRPANGDINIERRNKAFAAAREAFKDWKVDPTLNYVSAVMGKRVIMADDARTGVITEYNKEADQSGSRRKN